MAGRLMVPQLTTRGRNTDVCVAVMPFGSRVFPTAESLVIGATPAAKGATTIDLAAPTTNAFVKGQGLLFVDANDLQFFAVIDENADAGVSSLTVLPLGEEIPAAAAAAFPVRSLLRTSADLSESVETEEIDTFDHLSTAYLQTGQNGEFSAEGLYSAFDPGAACVRAAMEQGLRVYVRRTLEKPSDQYVSGAREEFFAIVTSVEMPATVDGSVAFNVSFQVDGEISRSAPVPVA